MKQRVIVKCMAVMVSFMLLIGGLAAPVQAKSSGYVFSFKGVSVGMHDKAKQIIKKAGKPLAKKVKKAVPTKGRTARTNIKILFCIHIPIPTTERSI